MLNEYVMSRLVPHITKKILSELFNGKNNGNIKIMCNDTTQAGVAEDCLLNNGRSEISLCHDYTEFALLKNKLVLL